MRDLFESYSAALGYPADVATQALILSAAEHITIAERTRAGVIAGEVAPTEAVRTQGAADRALRRIGLNKPATSKPAGPSLAQIRARYANTPSTPATSEAGG